MKRDMDLVRKIVFAIEAHEHGRAPARLEIEGHTDEEIGYHVSLMAEAGLVHGTRIGHLNSPSPSMLAKSLTWQGHEFADAARSETIWAQAKKTGKEKAGSVSIGVLTQYLQTLARAALGM